MAPCPMSVRVPLRQEVQPHRPHHPLPLTHLPALFCVPVHLNDAKIVHCGASGQQQNAL